MTKKLDEMAQAWAEDECPEYKKKVSSGFFYSFEDDMESKGVFITTAKKAFKAGWSAHAQKAEGLVEAVEKVVSMERYTFAECSDAEFMMDTLRKGLKAYKKDRSE